MNTLVITSRDVKEILSRVGADFLMDKMIAGLEKAFKNYDKNFTEVKQRNGFTHHGEYPSILEWMPVSEQGMATVKIVGYNPGNPIRHNLPTIISTISLYDTNTAQLKAIADGNLLTSIRTGAASAIVSRRHSSSPTSRWLACAPSRGLPRCALECRRSATSSGRRRLP